MPGIVSKRDWDEEAARRRGAFSVALEEESKYSTKNTPPSFVWKEGAEGQVFLSKETPSTAQFHVTSAQGVTLERWSDCTNRGQTGNPELTNMDLSN